MADVTWFRKDYIYIFIVLYCVRVCQGDQPVGYKGCYRFTPGTLERTLYSSIDNHGKQCKDACKNAGYQYAGTRAMNCWCGQSIGTERSDGSCDWGCMGMPGEICGGINGISLYDANYSLDVIAIVVGVVVAVIVIILVVILGIIVYKRKQNKKEEAEYHMSEFRSDRALEPKRGNVSNKNKNYDRYTTESYQSDPHKGYLDSGKLYTDLPKERYTGGKNKQYSDYKGDRSHEPLHPDDRDGDRHSRRKRAWSQYDDEDESDADSTFIPIKMDDDDDDDRLSYSSYHKSSAI